MILPNKEYYRFNFFIGHLRLLLFIAWEHLYDKLLFRNKFPIGQRGLPRLKKQECGECRECIKLCPEEALIWKDGLKLDLMRCSACEYCITVCPQKLLEVQSPSTLVITSQVAEIDI